MNKEQSPSDEHLIREVRRAFDSHAIPPCPLRPFEGTSDVEDQVVSMMPHSMREPRPQKTVILSRLPTVLAAIAAACIAIVAFDVSDNRGRAMRSGQRSVEISTDDERLHSENPPTKSRTADRIDEQGLQIVTGPQATESPRRNQVRSVADNNEPAPRMGDLSSETEKAGIGVLALVRQTNEFLEGRVDQPDLLIDLLQEKLSLDREALVSEIESFCKVSKLSVETTPWRIAWLDGAPVRAKKFYYRMRMPQSAVAFGRSVDAVLGDELFDPVLDAIRDAPEGPRADLRKDLFPKIQGELMVQIFDEREYSPNSLLIAFKLRDVSTVVGLVSQLASSEPPNERFIFNGIDLLGGRGKFMLCVASDFLLFGGQRNLEEAIMRLQSRE